MIQLKKLDSCGNIDTLRGKERIEISAGIVLASKDNALVRKHADIILSKQTFEGYWQEYSYAKEDPAVGYYGAVPTSFCIIALVKAYRTLNQDKYYHSALKASDYLLDQEHEGYFFKAGGNKSDVINTNLLAGAALH
ncbi:MAG: hypothetical protein ABIA93_07165 [Candidatus Woesearchaeota archaeon]